MRFALLSLLLIATDCPAQSQAVPQYHKADKTGQIWSSPDPVWLARWVSERDGGKSAAPSKDYGVSFENFPSVAVGGEKQWGAVGADAPVRPELYLTVVGSTGEAAEKVLREWETDPDFRAFKNVMNSKLAIHAYPKGHAVLSGLKIEADGSPDVLIQDAAGNERARFYADPGAAAILGELRRADPDYKPGDSSSQPFSEPAMETIVAVGLLAFVFTALVAFLLLLFPRGR